MFTKSKNLRNFLLTFYNFGGILCIKIQNEVLFPSKFQTILNISKIIFGITYQILYMSIPQIKRFIYNDEVALLKNYSDFSYALLLIAVSSFQYCMFVIVILQCIKYKEITKFLKSVSKIGNLNETYSTYFNKISIRHLLLVLIILFATSAPQFFSFLTFKKKLGIIIHMISFFIWVPSIAFVHLLDNFKLFLILNMKQIQNELNNWKFEERVIEDNLNKMRRIAKILTKFHQIFGAQLTIMSTECAAMFTLMVNSSNIN